MTATRKTPKDPDLIGADKAIKRAAKNALALARKTKTPCWVMEDGKMVDIASPKAKPAKGPAKTE